MSEDISPLEQLLAKHRQEKKDLQAKIQQLKKSVPKNQKAKVKEMRKTVETMQNDLKLKQEKELQALNEQTGISADDLATKVSEVTLEDKEAPPPKVSRAQKKREKKAAKAKEQAANIAEAEANYVNTARFLEEKQIKESLRKMGLMVKSVPSDGNCMYSAIEDQLEQAQNGAMGTEELRQKTASYIAENKPDFIPFLTNKDTGDMFTDEEFERYCAEIEKPSTWGSQVELLALCHILKSPIHVVQAATPVTVHGEQYDSKTIMLTYHRHELGLGGHYNSVTNLVEEGEES